MQTPNPLLYAIAGLRLSKSTETAALLCLMEIIHGDGPHVPCHAARWHDQHGFPHWERLEEWAAAWTTSAENFSRVQEMRVNLMRVLEEEDQSAVKAVLAFMRGV